MNLQQLFTRTSGPYQFIMDFMEESDLLALHKTCRSCRVKVNDLFKKARNKVISKSDYSTKYVPYCMAGFDGQLLLGNRCEQFQILSLPICEKSESKCCRPDNIIGEKGTILQFFFNENEVVTFSKQRLQRWSYSNKTFAFRSACNLSKTIPGKIETIHRVDSNQIEVIDKIGVKYLIEMQNGEVKKQGRSKKRQRNESLYNEFQDKITANNNSIFIYSHLPPGNRRIQIHKQQNHYQEDLIGTYKKYFFSLSIDILSPNLHKIRQWEIKESEKRKKRKGEWL